MCVCVCVLKVKEITVKARNCGFRSKILQNLQAGSAKVCQLGLITARMYISPRTAAVQTHTIDAIVVLLEAV